MDLPRIANTMFFYTDRVLIHFFRLFDNPVAGYFSGIALLSLLCVFVGEITLWWAYRANRSFLNHETGRMVKHHNLSLNALKSGSKTAYKACNKEANDAFGRVFFAQIALAAGALWPVPFALAWLSTRFSDVDFALPVHLPYIGGHVGFAFSFIPMYILVRIIFVHAKPYLPWFSKISRYLKQNPLGGDEKVMSLADLENKSAPR